MSHNLDHTNLVILKTLQEDCKLSNKQISAKVNKSQGATSQRVSGLIEGNYIIRNTAELNPTLLGFDHKFLIRIKVNKWTEEVEKEIVAELSQIPNVAECVRIIGNFDLELKIFTESTAICDQVTKQISALKYVIATECVAIVVTLIAYRGVPINLPGINKSRS